MEEVSLESVLPDYYLPLNTIRDRDEEGTSVGVSKKANKKDFLVMEGAGMSLDKYASLIMFLTTWTYPKELTEKQRKVLRHQARQYEAEGGVLYKKANADYLRRIVVRCTEVVPLLVENHDHILAGHQGVSRTFDKIKYKYYWTGYYDTVREYVMSCKICQNFGPRNPAVPISSSISSSQDLFSTISMDYIHLPQTSSGHMGALVIIDQLSGWVDIYPSTTQSASFTCLCLFKWFSQYGVCAKITCDNGLHFNSDEVKSLMVKSYGIELRFGIPFYPQGQGKVERANGVIKEIIKKYSLQYAQEWDLWLPAVLYVMRTSLRRDYDYSPFYLVYGRNHQDNWGDGMATFEATLSDEEIIEQRIGEIVNLNKAVIPQAVRRVEIYRKKMMDAFNKKAKVKKYVVGDQVLVESRDVKNKEAFLLSRWLGPYHVQEVVGENVYKVRDEGLVFPTIYHANQMKLYKIRPRAVQPLMFYSVDQGSHSKKRG